MPISIECYTYILKRGRVKVNTLLLRKRTRKRKKISTIYIGLLVTRPAEAYCLFGSYQPTADCRNPEKLIGIRFITFPNPKTKLEKCLRWIKACGRPHVQLNISNINQNKVICSTHFVDGNGPTDCYPDPVPADGSQVTPTWAPPKRRRVALSFTPEDNSNKVNMEIGSPNESHFTESIGGHCISTCDVECQTDQETRLIFLEEENRQLRKEIQQKDTQIRELKSPGETV